MRRNEMTEDEVRRTNVLQQALCAAFLEVLRKEPMRISEAAVGVTIFLQRLEEQKFTPPFYSTIMGRTGDLN
jgi:hypothetical protein